MRDIYFEKLKLLEKLGGLSKPELSNEDWLQLFEEETRHSIAIEGFFRFRKRDEGGFVWR
jgi:hypothetical protein